MGSDIAVVEAAGDVIEYAIEGDLDAGDVGEEDTVGEPAGSGLARRGQRGMVSAEWAVGIVAAIAIAGVLLAVITSGSVKQALLKFLLWVIETFVSVVS